MQLYVWEYTCAYVFMEARGWHWLSSLITSHFIYWDRVSCWTQGLLICLLWLTFPRVLVSNPRILWLQAGHLTCLDFMWVLGIKTLLAGKCFIHWALSPVHKRAFLKKMQNVTIRFKVEHMYICPCVFIFTIILIFILGKTFFLSISEFELPYLIK